MMRTPLRWLGCCLLCWSLLTSAAELAPVPPLNTAVTDLTQTLTAEQLATLEQQLREFNTRKGSQLAVLLVPTTQPETIEQYSIRVVDQWQLGRAKTDDGVLLLIAKQDRAVRIEVGDGLEGVITDAVASRIIRQRVAPQFQSGNFYQGISDAVTRIRQLIEGEALPEPSPGVSSDSSGRLNNVPWPLLLFVVFAGGGVLRKIFGRMGAAGLTSGAVGVLVWLFMSSLLVALVAAVFAFVFVLGGGGNGGGWSSGRGGLGGGWRGGSGGWGGGGFRGGGGGFSGGGASGRW